jgi:transcriptional regulator with XRE-family HTH domain
MYEELKKKMADNRYSALALAKLAGIKPSTLGYRLSGGGKFTISEAQKLSLILGIKPGDVYKFFAE